MTRWTMRIGRVVVALVVSCLVATPVWAQEGPATSGVNVFLDCNTFGCDFDFFRREIPVVNWVRDREVADVHVLITSRATGGGGRSFELSFLGLREFESDDLELTWASSGDAVQDEVRRGIAEQLKIGLVRYIAGTPAAETLSVSFGPVMGGGLPPGAMAPPGSARQQEDDPWDFWVFQIGANYFGFGESSLKDSNLRTSVSANRTTEDWKISVRGSYSRNSQSFELTDTTVEETREDWSSSGSVVKSIGGQWAVGFVASAGSSTFLNQDFRWSLKPGLEYNFFPYEESSRRSLTLQYLVGVNHWNYTEETIYRVTDETRLQESLTTRLTLVQPWGQWSTSLHGQHYLQKIDDGQKYSLTLSGGIRVRLFQGFSVNVNGNYSWIRDQLHIEAGNLTDEQILLRQRQLETSYRWFTSFGISYRFGSIFNNVVNPRFGRGGGEGIVIMM
jgi:hypothetical protein